MLAAQRNPAQSYAGVLRAILRVVGDQGEAQVRRVVEAAADEIARRQALFLRLLCLHLGAPQVGLDPCHQFPRTEGLGHAYGSGEVVIDGRRIRADERRGRGIHANAAMRIDPVLQDTCLSDPAGASAVFYDTRVRLIPVRSGAA